MIFFCNEKLKFMSSMSLCNYFLGCFGRCAVQCGGGGGDGGYAYTVIDGDS